MIFFPFNWVLKDSFAQVCFMSLGRQGPAVLKPHTKEWVLSSDLTRCTYLRVCNMGVLTPRVVLMACGCHRCSFATERYLKQKWSPSFSSTAICLRSSVSLMYACISFFLFCVCSLVCSLTIFFGVVSCVCVCACVCACVCICVRAKNNVIVCLCISYGVWQMQFCTRAHSHRDTYRFIFTHTHIHTYIYMYTSIYVRVFVYGYTHTLFICLLRRLLFLTAGSLCGSINSVKCLQSWLLGISTSCMDFTKRRRTPRSVNFNTSTSSKIR